MYFDDEVLERMSNACYTTDDKDKTNLAAQAEEEKRLEEDARKKNVDLVLSIFNGHFCEGSQKKPGSLSHKDS